ncbi:molybdopterin molybdotransferase MoeA [Salinisphaera aquimarina]|uniref:Molybdopterin molybdenumtransferase n=1 Tax=Salinisphaera aquimarina TaxID=2094031 RepID=A0ABV7EN75_9GAMM
MSESSEQSGFRPDAQPDNRPMPLADARARIIAAITPVVETERVALADTLHRVLAEDLQSDIDVPGADNSSMDGYGFAAADAPEHGARLRVVGESFAGHPFDGRLAPGECIRIMTGAVVPPGVDTIVMQENTRTDDSHVVIDTVPARGSNVRPAGEDLARGDAVMSAGTYLRPADIAVVASIGRPEVAVFRRPRVAFFSTGDELRPIDGPIEPGQIYDSNRYGLAALLDELGMDGINMGVVGDSPEALRAAFKKASTADAIVTSGGVSVGAADFVLDVLGEQGRVDFWRVAIKPGKPLAFGTVGDARFFGLPGNPVSTAVTFLQLVRPALVRMAGGTPAPATRFVLPTRTALDKRPGRENFLRARMEMDGTTPGVRAIDHQGSGVMRSMSAANCFIVLPAELGEVAAGTDVVVEPFAQAIWDHPAD